MITPLAMEMYAAEQRSDAMRHAARQRLAAGCAAGQDADNERSPMPAAAPTTRRWVVRAVGFVPALRPKGIESV